MTDEATGQQSQCQKLRRIFLLILCLRRRRERRCRYLKRFRTRPIFLKREQLGEYFNLVQELRSGDHEGFFNYFRMSPEQFDYLHEKIRPFITKSSLKRDSICSEERLSVTIRYLASGDSPMSLSFSYRMGLTSVHRIISETSLHIWQVLFEEGFVRAPKTPSEWVKIANEFERRWNYPNCCGAIDGKHIRMQAPPSSESQFYNYKHFHSIVLLAVVCANYTFTLVDIGDCGRHSDGGVFQNSEIGQHFLNNKLGFPEPRVLHGTATEIPFLFVGDKALPLTPNMMRPYPGRFISENKRIFNYRLSRARRVVKNAFGIASSRFRIWRAEILGSPKKVENITKAVVALHNFVIISGQSMPAGSRLYIPPGYADYEDR